MSMFALLNAIVLMITMFIKRRKRKDDDEYSEADDMDDDENKARGFRHRLMKLRIPALLAGIIPLILFLLLENIRLPIVWITRWTPLIGAFFILHMVLLLIFLVLKREYNPKDEDEDKDQSINTTASPNVV
jgi:H+/gluconate symporter-like permease